MYAIKDTMAKTFAPQYPRDDVGRVLFPPDHVRRRELFVPESFDHPARAQLFMVEELVKYLSEPGDLIVDPFGGSGTLLVGAPMGRTVWLIELSEEYHILINKNIAYSGTASGLHSDAWGNSLMGPCQDMIPLIGNNTTGVQAFIFSPPYAGALSGVGGSLNRGARKRPQNDEAMKIYQDTSQVQGNLSPYNLAGFNNYLFNQEMKKIYKLCLDALKPGGYTAVIIKDRISQGIKEELGYRAMQDMLTLGYEVHDWQRLYMAGSHYTQWHRSQGTKVIDEEHLIMMMKPL
jgi:tRNA G10  N-methylase Trm11